MNAADLPHSWSLPFSVNRVGLTDTIVSMGAQQIAQICQSESFKDAVVVNSCDSSYGCSRYLSPSQKVANLVSLTRLRYGNKVYPQAPLGGTGGAPRIYGEVAYLTHSTQTKTGAVKGEAYAKHQVSLYDGQATAYLRVEETTKQGKKITIELHRYANYMMRSKHGYSMKETVFDPGRRCGGGGSGLSFGNRPTGFWS